MVPKKQPYCLNDARKMRDTLNSVLHIVSFNVRSAVLRLISAGADGKPCPAMSDLQFDCDVSLNGTPFVCQMYIRANMGLCSIWLDFVRIVRI